MTKTGTSRCRPWLRSNQSTAPNFRWAGRACSPGERTKVRPQLLDQLAAWQEDFENGFDYDFGWRSQQARDLWAGQAKEIEADVRAELGNRAELALNLWPLSET